MYSFTLENLTKNYYKNDNLYDIFKNTIVDKNISVNTTFVQEGEEMRLDLISKRIYGTTAYVEHLMVINNIVNPWSIQAQDEIFFVDIDNIRLLEQLEKDDEETSNKVTKLNKNTRIDPNRNKGVIPTIKPLTLKQIENDKNNEKIKINTKLQ